MTGTSICASEPVPKYPSWLCLG